MQLGEIKLVHGLFVSILYAACPTGCSLCNGPKHSDCLACSNANLYRDTTNLLNAACVTHCGGETTENTNVFGVRTCTLGEYQYLEIYFNFQ